MDSIHDTVAIADTAEVHDLDDDYPVVELVNEETGGNTASIFFTVGSTDDDPPVPTVDGDGTIQLRPGQRRAVGVLASGTTRVRLICSQTEPFSITGYATGEWPY